MAVGNLIRLFLVARCYRTAAALIEADVSQTSSLPWLSSTFGYAIYAPLAPASSSFPYPPLSTKKKEKGRKQSGPLGMPFQD